MAEAKPNVITLENMNCGAASEFFDRALKEVLENIKDPNVDWKKARRITLDFTFSPDEERRSAALDIECSVKLPPVKPASTTVMIGRHEGKLAAVEVPSQEDLFPTPKGSLSRIEGTHEDDHS